MNLYSKQIKRNIKLNYLANLPIDKTIEDVFKYLDTYFSDIEIYNCDHPLKTKSTYYFKKLSAILKFQHTSNKLSVNKIFLENVMAKHSLKKNETLELIEAYFSINYMEDIDIMCFMSWTLHHTNKNNILS